MSASACDRAAGSHVRGRFGIASEEDLDEALLPAQLGR